MDHVQAGGLRVSALLKAFIETEALPGTGLDAAGFWAGLTDIVRIFAPRNQALLAVRAELQDKIDAWHTARRGNSMTRPPTPRFCTKSAICAPIPARFRSPPRMSTRKSPASPGRNWWCRSAMPATR